MEAARAEARRMTEPASRPRIFLIRHGETEWSLSGQHTGVTDLPLTERGEREARELRPWLSRVTFAHVFCSPRQRARRTHELSGAVGAAEIEPDLAEWNYGAYEGRTSASIGAERPGWDIFLDGCPGGESPAEVGARADRLIARLRALRGDIALFSHGEFSRVLASRWIEAPVTLGRNLALGTAALSILSHPANHPDTPVIELWNAAPGVLAISS
jgi:broad specificity phosphatase PhoE